MSTQYTIIQFAPHALSGERINIGVIAFSQQSVQVKFLENWSRVRHFAGGDVDYLKEFADEIVESVAVNQPLPGLERIPQLNEQIINKMSAKWTNSIQLTPPRASLKSVDELIKTISAEYLTQFIHETRDYRDRKSAASLAKLYFRQVLEEMRGKDSINKLMHPQTDVDGRYGPHTFDAVLANGTPYAVIQGVSFELPKASELSQLVDAVAFQVFDVRQVNAHLPIGILALPPKPGMQGKPRTIFERAGRTYSGLKADVLSEDNVVTWMREQVKHVPLSATQ